MKSKVLTGAKESTNQPKNPLRRPRRKKDISGESQAGIGLTELKSFWPEKLASREETFREIQRAIADDILVASENAIVSAGDSLQQLRRIPSHSVSLILTDPPYHATKKANIRGDKAFPTDNHYLDWISQYSTEWRRVLKLNGSLLCFCDSSMASRLDVLLSNSFNMLSHIVWTKPNEPGFDGWKGKMKKESLRQWYPHSERILFAEPAMDGSIFRTTFATLLREARKCCGLTMTQLTGAIGAHGAVNHGGAVGNWEDGRNTPNRSQYNKMVEVFLASGKLDAMPPYEDAIRVFNMDASREFTDIWNFPSVRPYKGKHPAEKPIDLLKHAIEATTCPCDIVLDCFAGSGSTALAAIQLGRRAVAIELDTELASGIARKVFDATGLSTTPRQPVPPKCPPTKRSIPRPLFN